MFQVSFEYFKREMSQRYNIRTGEEGGGRRTSRLKSQNSLTSGVEPEIVWLVDGMVEKVSADVKPATPVQSPKTQRQVFHSDNGPRPIYRTPEFTWSHVHIRLLSDLLLAIESDLANYKKYSMFFL